MEELFHAFSLHTLKQCFPEEHGWGRGTLVSCMTLWHLKSQVCNPFPSQMCCPAHMDEAWEDLSWDTSLQAWSSAPGSEVKQAGDQKKSCPLSRALAAQVPGERREGHDTGFLCWSGNQLWFFYHPNQPNQAKQLLQHNPNQPNQAKQLLQHSPTPAHRSPSVEPLLSQPHPVSCNRIFLFLYSTSMFVSWLFFRGFSQTISPVSQGSSKL